MAKKIKVTRFSTDEADPTKRGKIALAIVAGVVILLGGFALGRATDSKTPVPINTQKTSNIGEVRTGYGPNNTKTLIPSKFDKSTKGAVAAASTYISNSPRLFLFKDQVFSVAIAGISSKAYGPVLEQGVMASRAQAQQIISTDPNAFYRELPLGYEVVSESEAKVEIRLWSVNMLVAKPDFNGNTRSLIHNMTLIWEDGDWKIDNWLNSPGPTPRWQSENAPLSVEDFITSIQPFTGGYDYAPSF